MQPTTMQTERERAKAGHLIEKFRTIGPAAVLAALVSSRKQAANAGPKQAEPAEPRKADAA